MTEWTRMVDKIYKPSKSVRIAIVGKYVALHDAYMSVSESLRHAGIANEADIDIKWVNAEELEDPSVDLKGHFSDVDGILVPGGFGDRGVEGKIRTIQYARENKIPFFGLCLGMQCAVIEFARNVCGMLGAHSTEFNAETSYPVIDLMPEQVAVEDKGGTMRLGVYPCKVMENTLTCNAYQDEIIYERHRHRYEFNNAYRQQLTDAGLVIGGTLPNGRLVEIVEIKDHPWFLATQFHPEFKSRPTNPHPLFRDFVKASLQGKTR
jgi:CTP synthase